MTKNAVAKSWTLQAWADGTHRSYPPPTSYATDFPLTENPISEGGKWLTGGSTGLLWHDPLTTGGHCVDSTVASGDDDGLAQLKSSVYAANPKCYVEAVCYRAASYTPANSHEIELHLHQSIAANNATGYECGWGSNPDGTGYFFIVQWLGGLGSFETIYACAAGDIPIPQDGYKMRAEIVPNAGGTTAAITLYFYDASDTLLTVTPSGLDAGKSSGSNPFTWLDVTQVNGHTNTLSYIASGQPGMGYWPSGAADPSKLGWKHWEAGDL